MFSGLNDGLEQAAQSITHANLGAYRRLAVSGPWHSPLMEQAQSEFGAWLKGVPFRLACVPVLMNTSARLERDPEQIKRVAAAVPASNLQAFG